MGARLSGRKRSALIDLLQKYFPGGTTRRGHNTICIIRGMHPDTQEKI